MILDLIALDNSARVWIYQSDKEFTYDELDEARHDIFTFLNEWTAHQNELITYGNIFHRRFLALFVDETQAHAASGCSIDASNHFVQALGQKFSKNMFDRMTHAYMIDEDIFTIQNASMKDAYEAGKINDETLFFDNLVKTKGDFLKHWLVPLSDSWHKRLI